LANAKHQQAYFGIDVAQAQSSGYGVYVPGAGLRDARVNTSITYAINPRSSVTALVSLRRLLGDAADSPLTQDRDAPSAVLVYSVGF
jgi:outer membrane scaffolding protein for murein synthesis (MipA/OmpV family)